MVIFIFGEDGFRIHQKTRELVQAFENKFDSTGLNVDRLHGSSVSVEELSQTIRAQPFLAPRRMIVVRGFLSKKGKKQAEPYIEALNHHADHVIVILSDEIAVASAKKHAVYTSVKKAVKKGDFVEYSFPKLGPQELQRWVVQKIVDSNAQVAPEAVSALVARVGPDLWRMHHEIEKLVAYCKGKQISKEDVDFLVERHFEENIFAFTDSIGQRESKKAAQLLTEELSAGNDPFAVFAMIVRQIRILIQVSSYKEQNSNARPDEIARDLGMHPFVAKKTSQQIGQFTKEQLERLFNELLNIDRSIKTGRILPEQGLRDFLGIAAQV